ncbi:MAG: hypothetical protein IJ899_13060 [Blautia sp.]|nr:hypothetical protein [Blautia sp.]
MADVLELKDGSLITPVNVFDVLDVVEEHMGTDIRQYLEAYFADGKIVTLSEGDSLEEMKDHYLQILMNVDDIAVEVIKKTNGRQRLCREAIRTSMEQIRDVVRREG